jgi:hypothetical protein
MHVVQARYVIHKDCGDSVPTFRQLAATTFSDQTGGGLGDQLVDRDHITRLSGGFADFTCLCSTQQCTFSVRGGFLVLLKNLYEPYVCSPKECRLSGARHQSVIGPIPNFALLLVLVLYNTSSLEEGV